MWVFGLAFFGIAAGTELLGNAFGWNDLLYRLWYLFGAIMVAAYLGAGEVYLLASSRFGYLAGVGVMLGSAPALASVRSLRTAGHPEIASTAFAIGVAGLTVGVFMLSAQMARRRWVGHVTLTALALGTLASAIAVFSSPIDPTQMFDPATGVVQGRGFPEGVRLLTPLFNIAGASLLVFGAGYSAWQFWRKGLLPRRAASNALIALGGFVPSITSSLNRFGFTSAFYLGELLGVACILAGFLISADILARTRTRPEPEPTRPTVAAASS